MKHIQKGHPPVFSEDCVKKTSDRFSGHPPGNHQDYQRLRGATYDDYPCPEEWSKVLLKEQGYLCAYTMMRIEKTGLGFMKREHIQPQNNTSKNDLNHKNVVAVCMGNEGTEKKDQYADTRKGEKRLHFISPLHSDCERLILYRDNGEIYSKNENVLQELVDDYLERPKHYSVLNLNHQSLIGARYAAWEVVKRDLTNRASGADWRLQDIKDYIEKFKKRDAESNFQAFCCFVIHRLEKALKSRT